MGPLQSIGTRFATALQVSGRTKCTEICGRFMVALGGIIAMLCLTAASALLAVISLFAAGVAATYRRRARYARPQDFYFGPNSTEVPQ
jgi:hypothetical protein